VVYDAEEPCPYLEGQVAHLPLRLPEGPRIPSEVFDQMLEEGDRRTGPFFYRTACRTCSACEPIRIPVARFEPTKSQRRVRRKAEGQVEARLARPTFSERHLEIYNRHKRERGLSRSGEDIDRNAYRLHLLESPLDTREIRYLVGGQLVAFSILDFGATTCSSVYHCFDPDFSHLSLGVYSVLEEIAYCASRSIEWYYLGLYVADCKALRYKASYFPHQRKVNGVWIESIGDGG
jgi:arginine-tRNA-protein transferase